MTGFSNIEFDLEGKAFFTTEGSSTFYLEEFLMEPGGKGVAHISNVAGIEITLNDDGEELHYKLFTV